MGVDPRKSLSVFPSVEADFKQYPTVKIMLKDLLEDFSDKMDHLKALTETVARLNDIMLKEIDENQKALQEYIITYHKEILPVDVNKNTHTYIQHIKFSHKILFVHFKFNVYFYFF